VKVNIKRLSELSGYSPATISNALHNRRGVSQQTAAKVWKLARKAGYKVKSNVTNIKLVTYSDSGEVFSDSPFFTTLLEGVENEARRCGYDTTIYNLYRRQADYPQKLQQLLTDPSSAILLLGTELSEEDAPPFLKAQSPLVLLDCSFDKLNFDAVLMDNESSVAQAVDYLISQGHTEIGYLRGSVRIRNFIKRGRGYRRAMEAHGLPINEKYVLDLRPSIAGACEAMDKILQTGRKMPTAFIADNDMIALGAMQALQRNGYQIPKDVSVIGFDDINFCQVFLPHLSTIRVYKKELGQVAVQELLCLLDNPGRVKTKTTTINELVIRDSVAAPNKMRHMSGDK
jgi:DNA-binding LacI/PurR family transcriptional regulator